MQQQRTSYHSETVFQATKKSFIRRCFGLFLFYAFLLTLALPSTSFAQIKCEALFKPTFTQTLLGKINSINPFAKKEKLQLSTEEVAHLNELLNSAEYVRPYGLGRGEKESLFFIMWHDLPEAKKNLIVKILDDGPAEFKKVRKHFTEVLDQHKLETGHSNSFIELIINNYTDHLNFATAPQKFSDWLQTATDYFDAQLKSGELNLHTLRADLLAGTQKRQANDRWQKYAANELALSKDNNGHLVVNLKSGQQLRAVVSRDQKTIKLEVPRTMVGRAAWNPLYSEVLQAKISAGKKPPEVYDGFLATNGTFYLMDGNHRFAALETRDRVWIQMSYPAKTASMSISFDAIGLAQPSPEVLMDFFNGKLTLEDMIGGANAARIIYR